MFKKIIILLIFLLALFSCSKQNSGSEEITYVKFINHEDGMWLRSSATTESEKLKLIPYLKEVEILEETGNQLTMGDKIGQWVRISWQENEGWVFDAYLTSETFIEETVTAVQENELLPEISSDAGTPFAPECVAQIKTDSNVRYIVEFQIGDGMQIGAFKVLADTVIDNMPIIGAGYFKNILGL